MKNEIAKEVLTEFERLSDDDKNSLSTALEHHYGKQVRFLIDELSKMDQKDLQNIKSIIGGMIITREYAADIQNVHASLKDRDLPSRISFGIIGGNDFH
ncbi:hypothetical protein BC351_24025 [Paenibacillus ferrarius]|uniref:Uncharacterized protein n=1 Tax=Paenibacillus ferrarius TaxID=1469647 RepID=A0A1V4HLQ5_9BACL|nr:hypothetical protein [Paenibacillus ferrarius]OPH58421.1 hypothetical protein BC351_24025 [Paenibacillus ferrarius]